MDAYFVMLVFMFGQGAAAEKVGVYPTKESCVAEAKEAGLVANKGFSALTTPSYTCVKAYYPMEDKD